MLAGCIPVATRAGALPEVVGDTGVLVDDADPARLAGAIAEALAMDADARRHARERILENFGLDVRRAGLYRVVGEELGES